MLRTATLVTLLAAIAAPLMAQEKLELPRHLYIPDQVRDNEIAIADVTLVTKDPAGNEISKSMYGVRYICSNELARTIEITTLRWVKTNASDRMDKSVRKVLTKYKFGTDRRDFKQQLEEARRAEGWDKLNITKLEAVGKEKVKLKTVKAGGRWPSVMPSGEKEVECIKLQLEFSGMLDGKQIEAKETLWYSKDLRAVLPVAKVIGEYKIALVSGVHTQRLEMTVHSVGKQPIPPLVPR